MWWYQLLHAMVPCFPIVPLWCAAILLVVPLLCRTIKLHSNTVLVLDLWLCDCSILLLHARPALLATCYRARMHRLFWKAFVSHAF